MIEIQIYLSLQYGVHGCVTVSGITYRLFSDEDSLLKSHLTTLEAKFECVIQVGKGDKDSDEFSHQDASTHSLSMADLALAARSVRVIINVYSFR